MTCSQNSGLVTKVKCGIQTAASRRGFYAGLALGAAGLVGAGLVVLARRRSREQLLDSGSPPSTPQPVILTPAASQPAVPRLMPRPRAEPLARPPLAAERCTGCWTPGGSKPDAWYILTGRLYCPDCAPDAARQAGVDLVKTPPATPAGGGQKGAVVLNADNRQAAALSPEKRVRTHLLGSRIGLRLGREARLVPVEGYVVLRSDGSDTGLAINPGLKVSQRNGVATVVIEPGQWWLTHIPSGKGIAGPYASTEETHRLASVLAQIDWTRGENELTPTEIDQLRETVRAFNRALTDERPRTAAAPGQGQLSLKKEEPLAGKLLADGRGGVARVLEERGERLFMIDSLGQRYEIDRRETRVPDESDFELCRVAMSFDPTTQAERRCQSCGRSTRQTGAGEMWYRMGWQTFCETCARRHAVEEGYAFEEEIGDSLELEAAR